MICIWSSLCHCHLVICCFIKIQIGLTFLVLDYPVVPEKRPLNRCLSVLILGVVQWLTKISFLSINKDSILVLSGSYDSCCWLTTWTLKTLKNGGPEVWLPEEERSMLIFRREWLK